MSTGASDGGSLTSPATSPKSAGGGPTFLPDSKPHSEATTKSDVDYILEGQRLLDAVNLGSTAAPARYSQCDAIWRHPQNGATLFVGNASMASNREALKTENITRIVNCQDDDGRNYFEGDPQLEYLRFTIGRWRTARNVRDGGDGTWTYWAPLFKFVFQSLNEGHNVFVHCLAGAHRAGTAGIGLLMMLCGWDPAQAEAAAKQLRPAIDPIGGFPELLQLLQKARAGREASLPACGVAGAGSA